MNQGGLTNLAPGQLASMVTFLAHDLAGVSDLPDMQAGLPAGTWLERLAPGDLQRYRRLFHAVGAPWLWFSRLRMHEDELAAILAVPTIEVFALSGETGDLGIIELDFRALGAGESAAAELAFFGLVPEWAGRGAGRAMMRFALARAKQAGAGVLEVHTCSLDHPRALPFYCGAGFRIVRRAVEVFDDPRLDGTLPRDVAPQIPLIER